MPANRLVVGSWNAICDVCGFKFKSYQLRPRWDGLMVCKEDYETRHPQEMLKAKPEKIKPPWVRPEPPDRFLLVCNMYTRSAYADLGTADCMQADNNAFTYPYLLALYDDTLNPVVAPAPPPPAPPPSGSPPALIFTTAANSTYLPLNSVGVN